jgi:hypothetical protein
MIITRKLDVKWKGAGFNRPMETFPLDFAGLKLFFQPNGLV